jgi:hypothetical protein
MAAEPPDEKKPREKKVYRIEYDELIRQLVI